MDFEYVFWVFLGTDLPIFGCKFDELGIELFGFFEEECMPALLKGDNDRICDPDMKLLGHFIGTYLIFFAMHYQRWYGDFRQIIAQISIA